MKIGLDRAIMGTLPLQKILFGSPGTGKSYMIREIATAKLDIQLDPSTQTSPNIIKTVFHPEYTYGDFMGKLLPHGQGSNVTYKYYAGHFLKALGKTYRNILDHRDENVPLPQCLLVIDELNRGNASAIFGTVFQLLDREEDGWSSYEIDLSDLELVGLLNAMGYKAGVSNDEAISILLGPGNTKSLETLCQEQRVQFDQSFPDALHLLNLLEGKKIKLPPNLSIIGTINTSDESIYYLDSAFKRRWDWQYIAAPLSENDAPNELTGLNVTLPNSSLIRWTEFIVELNRFIRSHHQSIRRIEDKQIGWWFIKPINGEISFQQVKDKLLFYLWDTVFAKDRRPLEEKLSSVLSNEQLVTFADFANHAQAFMESITPASIPF